MQSKFFSRLAFAIPLLAFVAAATAAADPLANYTILITTDYGKSMARQFPAGTLARDVVKATVPDLAAYFGQKPKLVGVYVDQTDKKSGIVFFAETLNGQAVNGMSVIKVQDQQTMELITFCQANAPQGELAKLVAKPPAPATRPAAAGAAGGAAPAPPPPPPNLTTYNFPDQTGSVGVADGWTCNAKTIGGAMITGPADQSIAFDAGGQVYTPTGQTMGMLRMANRQAPANWLVGPYNPDPAEALKNLYAAITANNQRTGQPTETVDNIVEDDAMQVDPRVPNGHAAFIVFDSTKTSQGTSTKYRSAVMFTVYTLNQGQDTWGFFATQMLAPSATFDRDFPVMVAMYKSLKENATVIDQQGAQTRAALQAQFDKFQAENAQSQAIMGAAMDQENESELMADRSSDNFDELERGTRTMLDTQTGERTDEPLADIHGIVDNLNEGDPGRYQEIPLRDESDPLPGQQAP
jgi:hypothetical protein